MMTKNINSSVLLVSIAISLISCGQTAQDNKNSGVIQVEEAYSNPTNLRASDCFRKIRYIPLETTDSCLIGAAPTVQILGNRLIVSTGHQKQCFLFDKQTGKFISSVGHVGNDPQGYATTAGWLNEEAGCIYFPASTNKQRYVSYNKEGKYIGDLKVPAKGNRFMEFISYSYLSPSIFVGHYSASDQAGDRLIIFKDTTALNTFDTFGEAQRNQSKTMEDIAGINVSNNSKVGSSFIFISYKGDDKKDVYLADHKPLWHFGKDLYFKELFNDTIYRVTADGLFPTRIFDYGTYRWDGADRKVVEKDQAIFPTNIFENEKVILFRFVTNLFHDDKRMGYSGIFDKATGEVKVAPYEKGIEDDLTHFMPLYPSTMSPDGEFAAILPAEKIFTWFEENKEKNDLPEEVAALKKIGEEDNPVIVIME